MTTPAKSKPRRPLPVGLFLYVLMAMLVIAIIGPEYETWVLMGMLALYTTGTLILVGDYRRRLQRWKLGNSKKK